MEKTVLRASFGIFSVPVDLQQVNNASERPPFQIVATVNYPKSFQEPFQGRVDPFINFNRGRILIFRLCYPLIPLRMRLTIGTAIRNSGALPWSGKLPKTSRR